MSEWNGQTYRCPVHGLITGDEVIEAEIDYGVLQHFCEKKVGAVFCGKSAPYVGFRENKNSEPTRK